MSVAEIVHRRGGWNKIAEVGVVVMGGRCMDRVSEFLQECCGRHPKDSGLSKAAAWWAARSRWDNGSGMNVTMTWGKDLGGAVLFEWGEAEWANVTAGGVVLGTGYL